MKRFFFIAVLLTFFVSIISAQSAKQYFKAGQEFAKKMNYKDAIAQFDRVVEMDPDYEKAYIQRAIAYGNLNEFAKSADRTDLEKRKKLRDRIIYKFGKFIHSDNRTIKYRLKARLKGCPRRQIL